MNNKQFVRGHLEFFLKSLMTFETPDYCCILKLQMIDLFIFHQMIDLSIFHLLYCTSIFGCFYYQLIGWEKVQVKVINITSNTNLLPDF